MLTETELIEEAGRWASLYAGGMAFGVTLAFTSLIVVHMYRGWRQLIRD
ncbi:MAG: hypothetical protein AAGB26_07490 [Planctomycetota bacterium]